MSFLGPVGGFVREIVSNTVVQYAVLWLSEFVSQKIHPLWQRYWPVIYQSILVPAYHLVSDTIQPLLHDLRSNHGDSSAVSASESPPGGTSESSEGSELGSLPFFPGGEETTTVRQAFGKMRTDEAFEATTAKDLITAAGLGAAALRYTRVQDVLQKAAAEAGSSTSATRAPAGGTSAKTAKDWITEFGAAARTCERVQDVLQIEL